MKQVIRVGSDDFMVEFPATRFDTEVYPVISDVIPIQIIGAITYIIGVSSCCCLAGGASMLMSTCSIPALKRGDLKK